jgi:hypothetical protein
VDEAVISDADAERRETMMEMQVMETGLSTSASRKTHANTKHVALLGFFIRGTSMSTTCWSLRPISTCADAYIRQPMPASPSVYIRIQKRASNNVC